MQAEKIAERARKSISTFCIEECKSYCCRKGHLPLKESEIRLILNDNPKNLKKRSNGKHSFYLGSNGCPKLKDFKCTIHNNPERPKICQEFPIFVIDKSVRISSRCLAVRQNLLYPFIKEFMQAGYQIIDSVEFENLEIYPVKNE